MIRIMLEARAEWRERMAELARSEAALIQAERRRELASIAGRAAAASSLHISKRVAPKQQHRRRARMSGRGKPPRPANDKVRKSRASVSSDKSRRRPTNTPKQEHAEFASQLVRLRTAEEIANEQTAEQLALRIWAAMVGEKALSGMSALLDELLQSHLVDDDDEEGDDEGWLDDHHKREKKLLDEAIVDGLDKYRRHQRDQQSPAGF